MDLTDEALLERFRQTRDTSVFKSLLRRYQNRLYNAAFRILGNIEEAEDVVQDTYLKVHQNLSKFDPATCTFAAWLFRIAHNSCLDALRARQRKKGVVSFDPQSDQDPDGPRDLVSQAEDPGPGPAEVLDMSEQGRFIAAKLNELPETQRTVLVLHDIEGFSYQEIADIVGANLGTVRSRLHYGRLKLRELLEPYYASRIVSGASR